MGLPCGLVAKTPDARGPKFDLWSGTPRCPGDSVVKNPTAKAGDTRDVGLIPGLGRSPGDVHGNPLQYSCLENPMDGGAWQVSP